MLTHSVPPDALQLKICLTAPLLAGSITHARPNDPPQRLHKQMLRLRLYLVSRHGMSIHAWQWVLSSELMVT